MPIFPDFTEDYVCCSIDVFFTLISGFSDEFSINPISRRKEAVAGYDAALETNGFRPFYMQFKRPKKLKKYEDNLLFDIRYKQHMILNKALYNGENVAYVCPLFMDKKEYRKFLLEVTYHLPFLRKATIKSGLQKGNMEKLLPAHICITPKEIPPDCKTHRYIFPPDGSDADFHSKPKRAERFEKLDVWMENKFIDEGWRKSKLITQKNAGTELVSLLGGMVKNLQESEKVTKEDKLIINSLQKRKNIISERDEKEREGEKAIADWLWFGDYLRRVFRIHQYGFVETKRRGT